MPMRNYHANALLCWWAFQVTLFDKYLLTEDEIPRFIVGYRLAEAVLSEILFQRTDAAG